MESAHAPDRLIVKIVLTAAVAVAGIWFSFGGVRHGPAYFLVDDLAASGLDLHEDEYLRLNGFVVAGSIEQDRADPTTHRFMLTRGGVALRVVLHGLLPDTFKDQSEVVIGGQVVKRDDYWFVEGDEIFTKCGGKYQGSPPNVSNVPRFQ